MKNTAVQWYDDETNRLVSMLISNQLSISRYNELKNKAYEQAKEMEKDQIMNANSCGFSDGINHEKNIPVNFISCEQYYNKTFKSGIE